MNDRRSRRPAAARPPRLTAAALTLLLAVAAAPLLAPAPAFAQEPPAGGVLTLRRATELGLANDANVAAAAAGVASNEAGARLAADAFRPEAGVSSTPGVGRGLPVAVAGQIPAVASVDLRQSLYNNEQRAQGLVARATTAGSRAAWGQARLASARAVASLYARAWSDERLLAGADRRLAAAEAMSRRADALHAEGRATDLDLAQARLREARARLRRLSIVATRDADGWELRRRLGLPASTPLDLPADPLADLPEPTPPSPLPTAGGDLDDVAVARANDPTLQAIERQIALLTRAREKRDGWLSPLTIEADAQYSRLSRANGVDQFYVKFREDDWSVALALVYPLWSGGRLRDALARTDANLDQLKQQQRARGEQLEIDVHRAVSTLDQARAALDVAHQSGAVADADLHIETALAAEGRSQPDALDTRETAVADARDDEIKAVAALLDARAGLLAIRGDLLPRLGLPAAVAAPPVP